MNAAEPPLRRLRRALFGLVVVGLAVAGCGGQASDSDRAAPAAADLQVDVAAWPRTDFSKHAVPLSEFRSGGPGRDGIPPLDEPKFISTAQADDWLEGGEPVLVVELGGQARAYPQQILIWHEIVNDELAGRPIAVTYCPLCNSSLVFDRRVDGRTLTFGTTGNLRRSDLVMWDRQTESWWQQLTGQGVVGELTGTRLQALPSQTLSWQQFRRAHPDGQVLSPQTGFDRDYGRNPYAGYETPDEQPFLLEEEADGRLPAKERVVSLIDGEKALVVPFSRLGSDRVVQTTFAGIPLAVLYTLGVRSSLDDERISESKDVGTVDVFDRRLDGRRVDLEPADDGRFRDRRSGSTFDVTGRAVDGPLRGSRLRPVRHDQQFWFAIAAFVPDARILDG